MRNLKSLSTGRKNSGFLMAGAALFLAAAAALNICLGASGIPFAEVIKGLIAGPGTSKTARILWYVRLPRTAACILAGSGLAVAGAIIQKVLANNLASPGIIGINSGAGLAVAACCACGAYGAWTIAGTSFLGAMTAALLVVVVARKGNSSRTTVVLAGVAVTACLNAVTETIVTMVPDAALASSDFRVGGFSSVNQARLAPASVLILSGIAVICTMTNELDVLSLGDDTAKALGLRVRGMRNGMLALAALLAGASVSFAGILGFVGLIVPHMARRIIGNDSGHLIPFCALLGGGFVTMCDLAARLIFAPYELPTGILMNFLGGPFFIWLLLRRKESEP